jgi:hypothetical protein
VTLKKLILCFVVLLVISACTPASTNSITQSPTDLQPFQPTTPIDSTAAVNPEPSKENGLQPYTGYTSGALWLHLFSPNDGDVVSQSEINVSGQALPETVISLNDTILVVTGDGFFTIPVLLEEGPNVLELVASNMDGDEIYLILTIVYDK